MAWDSSSVLSLVVLAGVLVAWGTTRGSHDRRFAISWLPVVLIDAGLTVASSPILLLAFWQLHWFLVWAASQFWLSEQPRAAAGRWLLAGLLLDGPLVAVAWSVLGESPWATMAVDPSRAGPSVTGPLSWGLAIAAISRLVLIPIGRQGQETNGPLQTLLGFASLAVVPGITPLLFRLIDVLAFDPSARLATTQFFGLVAVGAMVCSVRTGLPIRRTAWLAVAVLSAAALFSISTPPAIGRSLWMISAIGMAAAGFRRNPEMSMPDPIPLATHPILALLTGGEAGRGSFWQLALTWPLRGAAHLARFLDSLLFEQLPHRVCERMRELAAPVTRGLPKSSLPAVFAGAAAILWIGLAILSVQ